MVFTKCIQITKYDVANNIYFYFVVLVNYKQYNSICILLQLFYNINHNITLKAHSKNVNTKLDTYLLHVIKILTYYIKIHFTICTKKKLIKTVALTFLDDTLQNDIKQLMAQSLSN